jgi:DNA-binding LytR/AlgR family response regulator
MAKIRILIVEDEWIIAEDMATMLRKIGYEIVAMAKNYDQAVSVMSNNQIDIALVDITLAGSKDGIEVAKEIREKYDLPFIFITSHSDPQTVQRAVAIQPNGYLVKPFEQQDIYTAIELAIHNFSGKSPSNEAIHHDHDVGGLVVKDSFFIKEEHIYIKVRFEEILWMKSDGNYIDLCTKDKSHVVRSSLKVFLDQLPENMFFQTHRSYVVNIKRISTIEPGVVKVGTQEVPLGRAFRDPLFKLMKLE